MTNTYRTTELWLAVYLKIKGMAIEDIVPTGNGRCAIDFIDTTERKELVKSFYMETDAVPSAHCVLQTCTALKSQINSVINGGN